MRVTRLVRSIVRALLDGLEARGAATRRRLWRGLAGGFLISSAVALLLVRAGQEAIDRGLLEWERSALIAFASRAPVSFNAAVWMDAAGNTAVLWTVVLVTVSLLALRGSALSAVALLVGHTANFPLVGGAWLLWRRDRPELIAGGAASAEGFFSAYPSGHVQQAVFVYGLLCWMWARSTGSTAERMLTGTVFFAATAAVGVARLRLGAHWPSDVLAGAVLGAVWAGAVAWAVARAGREARPAPNAGGEPDPAGR